MRDSSKSQWITSIIQLQRSYSVLKYRQGKLFKNNDAFSEYGPIPTGSVVAVQREMAGLDT